MVVPALIYIYIHFGDGSPCPHDWVQLQYFKRGQLFSTTRLQNVLGPSPLFGSTILVLVLSCTIGQQSTILFYF